MHRVLAATLAGSLLLTLGAHPAFGQADAAERERRARQHYEDGITQYNIANYTKAVEEYKRAYELTRAPALLFNIAQAYRRAGDCPNALTFYRNYVREAPSAPNRGDVDEFIKEVEICAPQTTPATPPTPIQPTPITPAAEPATPVAATEAMPTAMPAGADEAPPSSGKTLRLAGWITGGTGVAVFGLGVIYGLKAKGAQDKIEGCTPENTCDGADVERWTDDGNSWEKLGIGGMALGVALVGAGVTMVLLGSRGSSSESVVSAGATPGGGSVVWQGRF